MGCGCKQKKKRKAKIILNNRTWDEVDEIQQGTLNGLYMDEHNGQFPDSPEHVINWINSK